MQKKSVLGPLRKSLRLGKETTVARMTGDLVLLRLYARRGLYGKLFSIPKITRFPVEI
ncbi:MAG TPA: hypothetical protein VK722_13985 [Candidatus Aquilonibacter sp.]|nr:hypothetical protein [Candidatus Aquilonibacter sp.]